MILRSLSVRWSDARLGAGEKIEVVSKCLGRANVTIPQQIHAHVIPSMLEDTERLTHLIFAKRNSVDEPLTRGAGTPALCTRIR
jgi:hypothetical protein